jgi:hypothetical protein
MYKVGMVVLHMDTLLVRWDSRFGGSLLQQLKLMRCDAFYCGGGVLFLASDAG